ncbi:dimethylaniline monooxygenase [N-oxide-forming] 2-like [Mantella aurantiaca]
MLAEYSTMVKKVAVIGAGISGLAAIKSCLEEGLEPTCFEKSCDIGGLWRYTDEMEDKRASIYNSLVTNVSKETMCFSDFPMPEDFPNFLPNRKYFEYIKLYAERFNLTKYIQIKTTVCRVEKRPDFPVTGQWNVTTESDEKKKTAIFDAILVCTGQHVDPEIPINGLPGIKNFKGKVLHSREYKRPDGYDGKRVLIVGMGNTGVDISTELCTRASQVYLTTREGVWVLPRLGKDGYPFDLFFLRRINHWLENLLPASVNRWMLKRHLNKRFNHELFNIQPEGCVGRITSNFIKSLKPIIHLQCRWAARVFNGLHKLPDVMGMKDDMLKDEKLRKKWFATSENNFRRTNYIGYTEDLASDIGVKPNILKLILTDPVLAINVVFGTFNSYHFRINGPAKWDGAREAILTQWDRIEKPLRTRVPRKTSQSLLTLFMLLFFCFLTVFAAFWLKD